MPSELTKVSSKVLILASERQHKSKSDKRKTTKSLNAIPNQKMIARLNDEEHILGEYVVHEDFRQVEIIGINLVTMDDYDALVDHLEGCSLSDCSSFDDDDQEDDHSFACDSLKLSRTRRLPRRQRSNTQKDCERSAPQHDPRGSEEENSFDDAIFVPLAGTDEDEDSAKCMSSGNRLYMARMGPCESRRHSVDVA